MEFIFCKVLAVLTDLENETFSRYYFFTYLLGDVVTFI